VEIGIRKFMEADAEKFQAAVLESVEHVGKWLPWCTKQYTIEDAREWASSASDNWGAGTDYRFIIENSDSGAILGCVGINQVVLQHKVGNLGYWVRKSAISQGVCTRASRLAIQFAFSELGFNRIEIHVHPENYASNIVASRLGGQYEGVFRNKIVHAGISCPAKCYSVIPADYET